ncbi:hypothetical protein D210916BOD24_05760 [Alteromonas sp. D210916BOD_24]|uniref:hypothetical protein n=1 Tax=Alteromonas sp. D210916BOD_24 TaxID=3157618 RepID=UPI00399D4701
MAAGDKLPHSIPNAQVGFFSDAGELGGSHPQFTEICTALYERELIALAHSEIKNLSLLKRRMGGLPYHVKAIARYMVDSTTSINPSPLESDTHNGSWYAKQPSKCPGINHLDDMDKREAWYKKYAEYGLVVPVLVLNMEGAHIELDSIDMVNQNNTQLHLNKCGWFSNTGDFIHSNAIAEDEVNSCALSMENKILLRPVKSIMTSACCGHTWSFKSKRSPRSLTLREMRLSTQINWKNFTLVKK